jgi:hypothetical protein
MKIQLNFIRITEISRLQVNEYSSFNSKLPCPNGTRGRIQHPKNKKQKRVLSSLYPTIKRQENTPELTHHPVLYNPS